MEENVAQFVAITSSDTQRAEQYLTLTDNNLEHAIQLFFDSGGVDMAAQTAAVASAATTSAPRPTRGQSSYRENPDGTLTIDDSDDDDRDDAGSSAGHIDSRYDDDEAMARLLQEEAYGSGGAGAGGGLGGDDDVRAPMARTTETLVGPGAAWGGIGGVGDDDDENNMRAAIAEQLMARGQRRGAAGRPGIFNQRPSVWDNSEDPQVRRQNLARATAGASESSSKSSLLAELFRPPVDLISPVSWEQARDDGKEDERWIMVNIQDPSIFDCQVLNRDIWKNASIRETIKESFIFLQYTKDDPRAEQYVNYYFQNRDMDESYPHIAIVDPRTGEQVKVWSGPPVPKPTEFLMELHEFLDRYSLKVFAKNPVANRKPQQKTKDVAKMSEEEMFEMAMKNSLENGSSTDHKVEDPDTLTRAVAGSMTDGAETDVPTTSAPDESSYGQIPSDRPHMEPTDGETTRIQFRWSAGRVVRRFALSDPVQRLYEWLKADPLPGTEGCGFELIAMGKNLIEMLDQTVEQAGLKNGTVMVEHGER